MSYPDTAADARSPAKPLRIEVRALRSGELSTMLNLMCGSFGMAPDRAHPLFYGDPYFNLQFKRGLFVGGKLVSCLTVSEGMVWLRSRLMPIAGIAGVCTDEQFRGRGYASRLLLETLKFLHRKNYPFVGLYADPSLVPFYQRLGWQPIGQQMRMAVFSRSIPRHSGANAAASLQPSHLPAIESLHREMTTGLSGRFYRDGKRWDWVAKQVQGFVVKLGSGELTGYALYRLHHNSTGDEIVEITEMMARNEQAEIALWSRLASVGGAVGIQYAGPLEDAVRLIQSLHRVGVEDEAAITAHQTTGMLIRVVSLSQAVSATLANSSSVHHPFAITSRDWAQGSNESVTIKPDGSGLRVIAGKHAADWIEGRLDMITLLLTGNLSVHSAQSRQLLSASSQGAFEQAAALYPWERFGVSTADRF